MENGKIELEMSTQIEETIEAFGEKLKSEEVVKMNIIFMSGTMIVFALLLYTNLKMKDKGRIVNIVWCLNAYIVFRQSFGILDYEETRPHMS